MSNMDILNLTLSAVNALFAYDAFNKGHTRSGWISLFISAICFVAVIL